jgi:hypothetical protein
VCQKKYTKKTKNVELTDRSCPKCNSKGKPEIVVNGEVILAICPKYNAVQNNLPGYKIDPGQKQLLNLMALLMKA